jgi:hypothetical protein
MGLSQPPPLQKKTIGMMVSEQGQQLGGGICFF